MRLSPYLNALGRQAAALTLLATISAQGTASGQEAFSADVQDSQSAAESVVTGVGRFQIPFDIEVEPGQSAEGFAVLFGSQDGGKTWEKLQTVAASQKVFQFAAPRDGSYAFAVRMMDSQGNLQTPIVGSPPEMEVVVDTTLPDLNLQLTESSPGQVMLSWKSSDSNIDLQKLVMEYTDGQDNRWKPIRVNPAATGQTILQVSPGTVVSVRGAIEDTAGNRRENSSQLVLKSVAVPRQAESQSPPMAFSGMPLGPSPFGNVPQQPGAVPQQPGAVPQQPGAVPQQAYSAPVVSIPQIPVVNSQAGGYPYGSPPMMPVGVVQPVYGANNLPVAPAAENAQLVNNRAFELAYQLEDVGPSGVSAVELYVTENGGQQWFRYGSDTDLRSPMLVDVQGEGTFGFAVRVRNGLGFSDPPPQPGEPPTIVIAVDQTAPSIELPHPTVRPENGGVVQLGWRISERTPSPVAVRLEYATTPGGPWAPMFDWQADPGGFQWPVRPGSPAALFFRVLARDAAGNIASAQTGQPVVIDLQRPVARGLRVQAVSTAAPVSRGY